MPGVTYYAVFHFAGGDFSGWQSQPSARTVQRSIEDALERLAGRRVVTHAAGRTDAGVHSLGQVASFRMPERWTSQDLLRALRATLPRDIWAADVGCAPEDFNARRDATARRYRYVIGCDAAAFSPFRRPFEWALGQQMNWDLLRDSAAFFLGEHDFRPYSAVGQQKPHYHCNVTVARWRKRNDAEGFIFTVEADRFLHRMVRFMVGTMVDVGSGRRPLEDVSGLLSRPDNLETSPPAPPEGLYLLGARYPQLENEVLD
ncbi:MAG: tRNA pseudouridine(38-40) synthase TruA [Gemmatimonadales bacterium]